MKALPVFAFLLTASVIAVPTAAAQDQSPPRRPTSDGDLERLSGRRPVRHANQRRDDDHTPRRDEPRARAQPRRADRRRAARPRKRDAMERAERAAAERQRADFRKPAARSTCRRSVSDRRSVPPSETCRPLSDRSTSSMRACICRRPSSTSGRSTTHGRRRTTSTPRNTPFKARAISSCGWPATLSSGARR